MAIHINLSQMKTKILPTCFQGNYRDIVGEFSNTLYMACLGLRGLKVTLLAGKSDATL